MKKIFYALTILSLSVTAAKAQDGFDQLLRSGPADATKLVNAYANPLFKGIGFGINSNWNTTAATKGLLHFDLRVTASYITPPQDDKSFDVTKIGLSNNIRPANSTQTVAQTFSGSRNATNPTLNIYDNNGNQISSFTMPGGQLSFVPTPQIQLNVGLVKNTDLSLRYIPKTTFSNDVGTIDMFGFGLKHNIAQDFSSLKHPIPFDLSVAFGYNRLNYSKGLTVRPEGNALPANAQQSNDFSNQKLDGHLNSFMVQAIFSKRFLFITPFVAAGYNSAKTNVSLVGNYPITSSATITGQKFYTTYKDPVSISNTNVDGVRADVGFQLDLAFFKIYASYGISQQYNMLNGGVGFGF